MQEKHDCAQWQQESEVKPSEVRIGFEPENNLIAAGEPCSGHSHDASDLDSNDHVANENVAKQTLCRQCKRRLKVKDCIRNVSKEDMRRIAKLAAIYSFDFFCVIVLLFAPWMCLMTGASMLWSTKPTWWLAMLLFIFFQMANCVMPCLTCCCCWCQCCGCERRTFRGKPLLNVPPIKHGISRRRILIPGCILGYVGCVVTAVCLYFVDRSSTRPLRPESEWSNADPVAVVGAGASGLSAAWMLSRGGRHVTVYETHSEVGGHSKTWVEPNGMNFDLGFIFNNAHPDAYKEFKLFAQYFNHSLVTTALNTSSWYKGRYWDNTATDDRRFGREIGKDIDNFMKVTSYDNSYYRILAPLGWWLWTNGFSEYFQEGPLAAVMSVLFVTKMGLWKQSAQATLHYFRSTEGFVHLRYDTDKVQRGAKGSQLMWKDVLADMLATGRVQMRYGKSVTDVEKSDGRWTLSFSDGSSANGFTDVVLATPAYVTSKIVRRRPLQKYLVDQIHYTDAQVTLHTDTDAILRPHFDQAPKNVEYFVNTDPSLPNHLTGKIAKIFGYDDDSILLTVHDSQASMGGSSGQPVSINPTKVKWTTTWSHHGFTIWDILIARRFLPFFNGDGGLHYAGDWVYGVGHNNAIESGVAAACMVGIPRSSPQGSKAGLYSGLLKAMCPED